MPKYSVHGKNYIGGKWVDGFSGDFFESVNPANVTDVIGKFPKSGKPEVDLAVHEARKAFRGWRDLGMVKRAEYMMSFLEQLKYQTVQATDLVVAESGKQINEAHADVVEAIHMTEYAFSVGTMGRRGGVIDLETPGKDAFSKLAPRGVVVCITPWNFPMAIPMWEMALALVYGNTVVFKPSEDTPACGEFLAQLTDLSIFPPGVFNLVQGNGEAGWELVKHKDTNVILFTGSWAVGSKIKEEVAKHPNKICTIETGSKSAVIILKDAQLKLDVPAGILSAFKTAGQRCVSASRILVERSIFHSYVADFVGAANRIKIGDPCSKEIFYGPMINKMAVGKGYVFNNNARQRFDVLLDRNNEPRPTENGCWLRPFVYTTEWCTPDDVLQEESFSPHVALIPFDDLEHAIRIYNDTPYGLSLAVITEDYRKARWAEENAECGLFYWNLPCIGADVRLPFGGVKQSGNLIPSAAGIVPAITHQRAVTYNRSNEIQMAQGLSSKIE